MAFKITSIPSPRAYTEEIADFWELSCFRNEDYSCSALDLSRKINPTLDEESNEGIESEEDEVSSRVEEAFVELEKRATILEDLYPFSFSRTGIKLKTEFNSFYPFLLFATRLYMNRQHEFCELDGTKLFEHICSEILLNYLGNYSESMVFGTANGAHFEDKVNELIDKIGEGSRFDNPNINTPTKNDAALDVVAWKKFKDFKEGKLIIFGQCKTGTSWDNHINDLSPRNFCNDWLLKSPVVNPVNSFWVTDLLYQQLNHVTIQRDKLFFNRLRICQYYNNDQFNSSLKVKIKSWVDEAIAQYRLGNLDN